jgi:hypothetical protein
MHGVKGGLKKEKAQLSFFSRREEAWRNSMKRQEMSLGLTVLFVLSLGACLVLPVPISERMLAGRQLVESELGFLERRPTTRDDVAKQLGPATIWLESQRTAVYGLVKTAKTGVFWIIALPHPRGMVGGVVHRVEREALYIVFDQSDTVADWGRGKVAKGVTWLSAALDWSKSRDLKLPEPREEFVEIAPGAEQSVIYFYRPRDIQHLFPGFPPAESIFLGMLDPFAEVYLESALLGQLRRKTYLAIPLYAGTYDFRVVPYMDYNPELQYRSASIQMTLQAGLVYFVNIEIETGKGFIGPVISQRSRDEAMPLLKALRETW